MGQERESNSHCASQTEFQNGGADFARRHGRFNRGRLSRKHFSSDDSSTIRKLFLKNIKCHKYPRIFDIFCFWLEINIFFYWPGLRSEAKWGASIRAARDDARFSNPEIPFLREPRDLSDLFFLLNSRKKGILLQT
jgi:hypothetical protein